MAWQMGNPLSQTLFTSFYLDRMLWPEPKTLDQARFDRNKPAVPGNELVHVVLRAYCVGLIKSCDLVHRTISREQYYEVCGTNIIRSEPRLIYNSFPYHPANS